MLEENLYNLLLKKFTNKININNLLIINFFLNNSNTIKKRKNILILNKNQKIISKFLKKIKNLNIYKDFNKININY